MPPMHESPHRLFQGDRFFHLGIDVAAAQPFVSQLGPAMQVDGRDDPHVALSPLAATVAHLRLEQFERVEPEFGLRDFESFAEDGAGFVLHEEEGAVRFSLRDLLKDAE